MAWLYYFLLLVLALCGLFLNILGLPGIWLMVASLAIYGWITGWNTYVGWPSVIAVIVIGLLAELLEFLAGAAGSKAAGGRKRGMLGAVGGALVGGIVGSAFIPPIGTIIGACLGAFVGAAALELTDRDIDHAMRVGLGAAKGRFWGIVVKGVLGLLILVVMMIAALPIGGAGTTLTPLSQPASPPTLPTTAPSTFP